jgi:hypothetical protein
MSNTDPGHGNSVASWTTVIIIMVASAIGTVAFWFANQDPTTWVPVVYGSGVLAVVALLVGYVLKKAGYGVGGSKTKSH